MSNYEATALAKYAYYKHKDDWEQARFNSYCYLQSKTKKRINQQDIITFPWENRVDDVRIPTDEEIKQVAEWAKQIHKKQENE